MSLDTVLNRIQQLQTQIQPAAVPAVSVAPAAEEQAATAFATQLQSAMQTPAAATTTAPPAATTTTAPPTTTTAPAAATTPTPVATPPAPESPLHGPGCCCCCCSRPAPVTASAESVAPVQATTTTQPSSLGEPSVYDALIEAAGRQYGVDPALVKAVIKQESGFDLHATSGAGAEGLMQLMPATARGLGITDPYDPAQAIDAGTRYLKAQLDRFGGDESLALAAYNAGPNAVARYGGVPPYAETQRYVQNVLANFAGFKNPAQ